MAASLLQDIYRLGEEITSSLSNGDLDRYFELLDERGTLLDTLSRYKHPSEIDPDWENISRALKEQHHVIMDAVTECERRMQNTLTGMERFKDASRSYHQPEQRTQILNDDLRV